MSRKSANRLDTRESAKTPGIVHATRSYERWLRRQTRVVADDLAHKHERMTEGPFAFLRGTFYRWLQRWPTVCADQADAPTVAAVGDVHIENFGTWRDSEGRLVWGINDVDESCPLPYTNDLVRLATSVTLAIGEGWLTISERAACGAILEGYGRCLSEGGRPVVLAEHQRWLRDLALSQLANPVAFWQKLRALKKAGGDLPHHLFRSSLPDPRVRYDVRRRVAGLGSLGHRRFVALAAWGGSLVAREAKARAPSAAAWASGRRVDPAFAGRLLQSAMRIPDPCFVADRSWIVRRLAPDCAGIEMADLPRRRDEKNLLRAMGWETGNVHLASRTHGIVDDLRKRPTKWLQRAAERMSAATWEDWRDWRRRGG